MKRLLGERRQEVKAAGARRAPLLFVGVSLLSCEALLCALLWLGLPNAAAYAWGNGGDSRLKLLADAATNKPDTSSETSFTLNVKPVSTGAGLGLGTHDFILEQAIAQAIRAGADVSWIDFSQAQKGTSDPDKVASVNKRFPWGGDWHGTPYAGKAPRDIGIIYREIVAARKKGDKKTASRKLGWLAHLMGDLTMPMHIVGYSRYIPQSRQHTMHVAAEADLDRYQKYSVGRRRDKWPADVSDVLSKYLPGASAVTTATTPQDVRKIWFGGTYKKPPAPTAAKTARALAISTASKVRKDYGKAWWQNWAKGWKKGYKTKASDNSHPSRGTATKYLVKNAPAMLNVASTNIGTLIVALSDTTTMNLGVDHIQTPSVKVTAPKRQTVKKKSKTGRLILKAKGAKRKKLKKKYLAAPKKLTYSLSLTIKASGTGKAVATLPLSVKWRNAKGKTLKTVTVWTNSSGKVKTKYALTTPKKKAVWSVSVTAPTTDLAAAKTVKFTINPKKFSKKFK
ncbi:MAG: hypothetical protein LBJ07_04040 [Actinomycetes bacterium]|jgi:hypothetical protein|nr:hypothetical protein [Actinomycetes bacterium]